MLPPPLSPTQGSSPFHVLLAADRAIEAVTEVDAPGGEILESTSLTRAGFLFVLPPPIDVGVEQVAGTEGQNNRERFGHSLMCGTGCTWLEGSGSLGGLELEA